MQTGLCTVLGGGFPKSATKGSSSNLDSSTALEEGMATHSSLLAWSIPRTEEPGGLQSTGSQRVGHDWSDLACMHEHRQSSTGSRYRLSNLPSYSPFSPSPHPLFLFMTFFSPVLDDSFHYISVKKRTRATDRHWEGGNGGWELGGERESISFFFGGPFLIIPPPQWSLWVSCLWQWVFRRKDQKKKEIAKSEAVSATNGEALVVKKWQLRLR